MPTYLTTAIKYWNASLNDDQTMGDNLGCTTGASADWQTWAKSGSGATPPIIITVTHDTGYPMRWYGPYIALAYDWLHDAPGVDAALLAHTRTCLGAWVDYYNEGRLPQRRSPARTTTPSYALGKTLTAIALGGEDGANSDRRWMETVTDLFGTLLVGKGLAGAADPVGMPAGVLAGGDWGEGWQYGPAPSVLEYAAAAQRPRGGGRAPARHGRLDQQPGRPLRAGVGPARRRGLPLQRRLRFEVSDVYPSPNSGPLDAVLTPVPSSDLGGDELGGLRREGPGRQGLVHLERARGGAHGHARGLHRAARSPPPWRCGTSARGTRDMVFARTDAWMPDAFWGVFSSPPQVNSDHHHFSAGNVVFSRGADHLLVDPSNYGEPGTLETDAPTVDSPGVMGDYAPSQTPWSEAELLWARGTADAVFAARGDFARAFTWNNEMCDIKYAHREWVMLPEGEVVTVDRAQTADATHNLYVSLHANTAGTLKLQDAVGDGHGGRLEGRVIHGGRDVGRKDRDRAADGHGQLRLPVRRLHERALRERSLHGQDPGSVGGGGSCDRRARRDGGRGGRRFVERRRHRPRAEAEHGRRRRVRLPRHEAELRRRLERRRRRRGRDDDLRRAGRLGGTTHRLRRARSRRTDSRRSRRRRRGGRCVVIRSRRARASPVTPRCSRCRRRSDGCKVSPDTDVAAPACLRPGGGLSSRRSSGASARRRAAAVAAAAAGTARRAANVTGSGCSVASSIIPPATRARARLAGVRGAARHASAESVPG